MTDKVYWTVVGMKNGLYHLVSSHPGYFDRFVDPDCFSACPVVTYATYVEEGGYYYYAGRA